MVIGDFRIDGFIAQGGMGRVYTATNRTVANLRQAVKVLHDPTQASDRERFLKEAQAASTARSGNIVSISNFGFLPEGQPFLMMELLEGRTLEAYLLERKRLPHGEALALAQQVLAALKVIHDEAKIVHRDLKPANLFLVRDRSHGLVVKVMDLGMASTRPRVHPETGVGAHLELDRGGTPAYASPEQFGTYAVGTASDIYSLGVVLYEMVTGQLPFPELPGESDASLARRHVLERPRDPQVLTPGLPEEVASLILAMLAKEPPARPSVGAAYNTVVRLRERYKDRQAEGPTHVGLAPGPPSPSRAHLPTDRLPALEQRLTRKAAEPPPPPRRWPWMLLVLALLFLVGALGALVWADRAPAPVASLPAPVRAPERRVAPAPVPVAVPVVVPVRVEPPPAAPPASARAPVPMPPGPGALRPMSLLPRPAPAKPPEAQPPARVVVEEVPDACRYDDRFRDYARRTAQELRELARQKGADPDGAEFSKRDDALSTALVEKDCRRANLELDGLRRLVGVTNE
jgi:serine/threonine-protein kinase